MNKNYWKRFMNEWGFFILFLILIALSRLFIWGSVRVDGHSMDPTLADGENLIISKISPINRFDIVVAEEEEDGTKKAIVKRVVGMPGDTIRYDNDKLYINGKETEEPYLKEYIALFQKDKLQETYSYSQNFQLRAQQALAFTVNDNWDTNFTITVPEGEYLLLGDDRLVSKDSRQVGTFKKDQITGEVIFRFWPFNRIGQVD
ncbi:Signal peptidase I [Streptococcus sp. DD10]|uniref:signal peptidase I n=1 Tax=Streptococcus sp. DD10 TaxID=1777878 RepID=UPI0007956251|nr:signal peptidase I [Streptococcus sp. DD10]KXT74703.1 Signal peptidase I [Streptococcus sp. DD10]